MSTASLVSRLQSLLDEAVESGLECGCQLAVYIKGELVADLCAGYTTPSKERRVTTDSLFPVFSSGKGIVATAIHRLVEKGVFNYSTRIGDIWPEFACNGKENTLLWHLLTHRGGLYELPKEVKSEDLIDWNKMCRTIEQMHPLVTPGTKQIYHPISFAWLMGEPAARADGRPFKQILSDEVLAPLMLDNDVFFGTTPDVEWRVVPLDTTAYSHELADMLKQPQFRAAFIPSFNGIMSARALAKHYAALDTYGVDGVQLLSPETVENASRTRRAADDPAAPGEWSRFGLGYVTFGFENDLPGLIGHGGAVGSEGLLDRRNHIALGFTKNKVSSQHPYHLLRDKIAEVLGLPIRHW